MEKITHSQLAGWLYELSVFCVNLEAEGLHVLLLPGVEKHVHLFLLLVYLVPCVWDYVFSAKEMPDFSI